MLALICRRPFLRRRNLCLRENVGHVAALEQPALVDPGAEVGRDGDVGRGGDDAVGERRRRPCARSSRMRPNAAWVDCSSPVGAGMAGMAIRPKSRGRLSRRDARRARSAPRPRRGHCRRCRRAAPIRRPRATPNGVAQGGQLGRVHQARVIVLVAGERQAVALDRPGDEQGRHIVLARRRTPRPAFPCNGRRGR